LTTFILGRTSRRSESSSLTIMEYRVIQNCRVVLS
jgi:hypothetical protein